MDNWVKLVVEAACLIQQPAVVTPMGVLPVSVFTPNTPEQGVTVGLKVGVPVQVGVPVAVEVRVGVPVFVRVGVEVVVGVLVAVIESVAVWVGVEVSVPMAVAVGVKVAVQERQPVGVADGADGSFPLSGEEGPLLAEQPAKAPEARIRTAKIFLIALPFS